MKKKTLILCALLALCGAAWAQTPTTQYDFSYEYGGTTLYYKINDDNSSVTVVAPYDGDLWGENMIPSGSIDIPAQAYYNDNNSNSTYYDVTAIGNYAFCFYINDDDDDNITSHVSAVTIPNSVTSIGEYAFTDCPLTSIVIPGNVNTISDGAFSGCDDLTTIFFAAISAPTFGDNVFDNCSANLKLYVPFGKGAAYRSAVGSNNVIEGVLADGEVYSNASPSTEAQPLCYVRSFPANTWVPLFVPFSSSVSDWEGFTIAQLSYVSSDGSSDALHWQTVTSGTIEANTPYIIKYTGATEGSYEFTHTFTGCNIASSTDLHNVEKYNNGTETNPEGFASSATRCYNLIGTYVEMNGTALTDADAYCMGGGNFHHATSSNALHAQRFYLTITNPSTGENAPAPASMCVMVNGEVVGILEHIFEPELLIDDNYYDVLGRRIDNPQPGQLYIHQGKKIIYSE